MTGRHAAAFVLLLSLLPAGCAMGPSYKRPIVDTPADFRAPATNQQTSLADLPWWELFQDDTLKELVKVSMGDNQDLAAAVARVEQARQLAGQARSQYFPGVNYSSLLSRGDNQFLGSPASDSVGAQGFFLGIVRATWEVDLWGRIRRTNEAARAHYFATDEARRGVMLSLTTDVSQAYFELLGLRYQLQIARETVQAFTETRDLFSHRLHGGIGNALQVSRVEADLASATATVPELERLIALKENQINVLLGRNPGAIATPTALLDASVLPDVPAGLPSTLLERRPDILAAAQRVRVANAEVGIAQTNFLPAIGLTTFFGKLATPLAELSSSDSNAWSVGGLVGGPVFHAGALRARKRQAVAHWEQVTAEYNQTALNAFRDVSDALVSRAQFDDIRAEQMRAVQAGEEAVELAQSRYLEGLASYIEVLEALQRLYPARLLLAQTEVNRRIVILQLYRALGGGWNLNDAQWMAADPSAGVPGAVPTSGP